MSAQGHWCNFCQTHHSSVSCFHPSNPARYVHSKTGHGSATGANETAVTAYVEDWKQRADAEKQRADEAEAQVERLKGQDCASCSHTKQDTALYPPPPPNHEVYSYCGCPDSPCYMRVITPVDRCTHWSARLTQRSKEPAR